MTTHPDTMRAKPPPEVHVFKTADGRYRSPQGKDTSRTKAIGHAKSILRGEGGGIVKVYDRKLGSEAPPDEEIRVFA